MEVIKVYVSTASYCALLCYCTVYPEALISTFRDCVASKPTMQSVPFAMKLTRSSYAIIYVRTEIDFLLFEILILKIYTKNGSYPRVPIFCHALQSCLRLIGETIIRKFMGKLHLCRFICLCFLCYYSYMNSETHLQRDEKKFNIIRHFGHSCNATSIAKS